MNLKEVNRLAAIVNILAGLIITVTSILVDYAQNCSSISPCSSGVLFGIDVNFVVGPVLFMLGLIQLRYVLEGRKTQEKAAGQLEA